jgi:hypothetical protein
VSALVLLPVIILLAASIGWTLGRGYQKLYGDRRFRWWRLR